MSIKFCDYCGNMLTPSEDKERGLLKYKCQICDKTSEEKENTKENNIVYRNEIKLVQTEVKIDNSIINDPTYARAFDRPCPECGYKETICFQNPNINDPGMKLIYVCCNKNKEDTGAPCGHYWFKEGVDEKNEKVEKEEKKI